MALSDDFGSRMITVLPQMRALAQTLSAGTVTEAEVAQEATGKAGSARARFYLGFDSQGLGPS